MASTRTADLPYSIQSSPVELNNGATLYDVDGVAMDMERQVGNMTLTLTGYDRTPAGAVAIDSQSATVGLTDGMADFRASGRSVAIALSGSGLAAISGSVFRRRLSLKAERAG